MTGQSEDTEGFIALSLQANCEKRWNGRVDLSRRVRISLCEKRQIPSGNKLGSVSWVQQPSLHRALNHRLA